MSHANVVRFLRDHQGPRRSRLALVSGAQRWTYAELEMTTDRWARALLAHGVVRGERVALLVGTTADAVVAMLAAAKVGAVCVPLNTRWAVPELAYALEVTTPVLFLADEPHVEAARAACVAASARGVARPEVRGIAGLADDADPVAEPVPYAEVGYDDPLRILFTSGTTSRPKGVVTTHGNSAWNHRSLAMDGVVRSDDTVLVCSPLFHVSGLEAPGIFGVLAVGGTCVLLDSTDTDRVVRAVEDEAVTGVVLLPPVYGEVVEAMRSAPPVSLRWVLTGGLDPSVVAAFQAALPGRRVIEVYAMTEATGPMTVLDELFMTEKAGRTGRAVRNLDLRVVDETGHPVPVGSVGTIQVRGPKVSPGYWGPERSEPARADWFDTGDLGDLDADGYLAYHGRGGDVIKSGGENVSLAEVERVIAQHPEVQAVCLVRIPHPRWSEVPKAFVLPVEGGRPSAAGLEEYCRERLAGFKVPRTWELVADLPYNHSGKVLRRVLQAEEDERQRLRPSS